MRDTGPRNTKQLYKCIPKFKAFWYLLKKSVSEFASIEFHMRGSKNTKYKFLQNLNTDWSFLGSPLVTKLIIGLRGPSVSAKGCQVGAQLVKTVFKGLM